MKIVIGDVEYAQVDLSKISVGNLIRFDRETGMTRKGLREMGERLAAMTEEEREDSADALILTGITVWLARLGAGEDVSFEEACDVPLADLQFIPEPGDEEAAPDPHRAPPGSGRGDAGRPPAADHLRKKTSKKGSIAA